jgi:hypothetical protein
MLKLNNTKRTALFVVAVFATALIMGPSISGINNVLAKQKYDDWEDCRDDHSKNWCKKYFKDHNDDDNGNGNSANQGIGQSQSSRQNSQCVSGDDTDDSCNNFSFQNQNNEGNNAAAQSGGNNGDDDDDDDNGGNSANQGIGQSQSSKQSSQVVSGDDTEDSGNNFSFQNQNNEGNNALAQQ